MLKNEEILQIIEENQNKDNLQKTYEIAKKYTFSGKAFCEISLKTGELNFGWSQQGQKTMSEFKGTDTNITIISIATPIEEIGPEDLLDEIDEFDEFEQWSENNDNYDVEEYVIEKWSEQELEDRMYFVYEELADKEVFFKDWDLIQQEVIEILLKKAPQQISATETADILGVTSRAIRLNCENGKYECRKAGGVWLIDKDSVIESLR